MKTQLSLLPLLLSFVSCTLLRMEATSQTTVPVGQIQSGVPVLTTTASQFTTNMSSFFPGKSYSNLQLLAASDANGQYYYLNVSIRQNSTTYPAVIILEQIEANLVFGGSGCEMSCTASGCNVCSQTIHEKCKEQTCTCNVGGGSCSSSIGFPN